MRKALVHVSGGFDSVAVLAEATQSSDYDGIFPWFCDYGQPYNREELAAAKYAVRHYRTRCLAVRELQVCHTDMHLSGSVSPNEDYYPMRNLVLTALSINWAMAYKCEHVLIGSKTLHHRPDDLWSFQDSCKKFFDHLNIAVSIGTEAVDMPVTIRMPIVGWSKTMVVMRLLEDGVGLRQLWSCYRAGADPCGVCHHCQELRRALGPRAPLVFGNEDEAA